MKNVFISGFIGQRLIGMIEVNTKVLARKKQPNYETIICNLQSEVIPDQALNNVNTVFHLA